LVAQVESLTKTLAAQIEANAALQAQLQAFAAESADLRLQLRFHAVRQ
jgi:hypothetical protein